MVDNDQEHVEETLLRISRGLPVPPAEVDRTMRALFARWTDPASPVTWLKRPETRTCLQCRRRYISKVSLLAVGPWCSPACRQKAAAKWHELCAAVETAAKAIGTAVERLNPGTCQ